MISCDNQLPNGNCETTLLIADGRGRRAWDAGSSVMGLMPGGRVLVLAWTVAEVSDVCVEFEGEGRGG